MDENKKNLIDWEVSDKEIDPRTSSKWFKGNNFNKTPSKTELGKAGLKLISMGVEPKEPFITSESRVLGLGSCFARFFILWLAELGYNKKFLKSPYNALLKYGADFESVSVIGQQFRWAFNEFDSKNAFWVDKNKAIFEATEERKNIVRETLENTDVLILTLGLSEIWFDKITKEPLWRTVPIDYYDPTRYDFKIETVSDTIKGLNKIEEIRKKHLKNLKIIFTLSPIRLGATFRPVSSIVANSVSKAIIRAALDEFLREHSDIFNKELFYFPSYEIVNDYFHDPFDEDNRHLMPYISAIIIKHFARIYLKNFQFEQKKYESTSLKGLDDFLNYLFCDENNFPINEKDMKIRQLEKNNIDLKKICDERLKLIDFLSKEAEERLRIINLLDSEVKSLKSTE